MTTEDPPATRPPTETAQAANYGRALAAARDLVGAVESPTAAMVADRAGMSLSTYHRAVPSHTDLLQAAGLVAEPSTREQILAAASQLLGQVGFVGLTMDEIAAAAKVSRSTLYRLFPGKEEILKGLADSQAPLAALGPILEQVKDTPAAQVLPMLLHTAAPRLMANRHLLRAVLAHPLDGDGNDLAARGTLKQMFAAIGHYLEHQMDTGRLRRVDPGAATVALLGPLYTFVVTRPDLWNERTLELEQLVTTSVELWLRGMQP